MIHPDRSPSATGSWSRSIEENPCCSGVRCSKALARSEIDSVMWLSIAKATGAEFVFGQVFGADCRENSVSKECCVKEIAESDCHHESFGLVLHAMNER